MVRLFKYLIILILLISDAKASITDERRDLISKFDNENNIFYKSIIQCDSSDAIKYFIKHQGEKFSIKEEKGITLLYNTNYAYICNSISFNKYLKEDKIVDYFYNSSSKVLKKEGVFNLQTQLELFFYAAISLDKLYKGGVSNKVYFYKKYKNIDIYKQIINYKDYGFNKKKVNYIFFY